MGFVFPVGVDLLFHPGGDVDDAVDLLLEAGEVVFLADAVGLEAGVEVFGVVLTAAGHPRGGFDAGAGDVVVRVLFVVAGGVIGDDDVGLEEAEEEDEPLTEFAAGDVVHHVVVVVEFVGLLDAEDAVEGVLVALVGGDGFGVVPGAGHVVVRHADHVGGGAFVDQFGVKAGGEDGDIVRVGLDRDDYLARAGERVSTLNCARLSYPQKIWCIVRMSRTVFVLY